MDIFRASTGWTYYHMRADCIGTTDVVRADLEDLVVDCARLPKSAKESIEAFLIERLRPTRRPPKIWKRMKPWTVNMGANEKS